MGIWKNLGMGGYRGFSRPAARLLQQAVQLAGDLGCEQADTGHLLLAMLQQHICDMLFADVVWALKTQAAIAITFLPPDTND